MRRPVRTALIAALPIALVNLPPTFAIDIGVPAGANCFLQFIAMEWIVMHWPGLWLTRLDPYFHFLWLDYFAVFLSGYVEWALLLIAGIHVWRFLRRPPRSTVGQ
jgi:hypothetical protein